MLDLLWIVAIVLAAAALVAVLDLDVQWRGAKLGRPLYGVLVLGGLGLALGFVLRDGALPLPGWIVTGFGLAYLPFLSSSFIDLDLTDRVARAELEALLLERDFAQLRHASGERLLSADGRRLRIHWECRVEDGGLVVELDAHPSLLWVTVSRPHIAFVRDQAQLDRIRADLSRRRAHEGGG